MILRLVTFVLSGGVTLVIFLLFLITSDGFPSCKTQDREVQGSNPANGNKHLLAVVAVVGSEIFRVRRKTEVFSAAIATVRSRRQRRQRGLLPDPQKSSELPCTLVINK